MGHRELKRVPLDFAWPQHKVWGGYLNPHYSARTDCPDCEGSGYAPKAKLFSDQWYGNAPFDPVAYGATPLTVEHPAIQALAARNVGHAPDYYGSGSKAVAREAQRLFGHFRGQWCHHLIQADVDALVDSGRLYDFVRVPLNDAQRANCYENGWTKEPNGYRPSAGEINAWSIGGMGHDGIDRSICIRARCEREHVEIHCPRCGGDGEMWATPEAKAAAEAWEPVDPPEGPGYQLWETTSEGSPVSPVFATAEELAAWCADNASVFADMKWSVVQWLRMFRDDADGVGTLMVMTPTSGGLVPAADIIP